VSWLKRQLDEPLGHGLAMLFARAETTVSRFTKTNGASSEHVSQT
jgi:hypothetical protein